MAKQTKGVRRRQRSRGASCALGLSTIFQSVIPPSEMVGRHGFAPCSRRVRAGTSLSKFATRRRRDAKAELNRRSQAYEVLAVTGIRVARKWNQKAQRVWRLAITSNVRVLSCRHESVLPFHAPAVKEIRRRTSADLFAPGIAVIMLTSGSLIQILTSLKLRHLAGPKAFKLGVNYFDAGQVVSLTENDGKLFATVQGTDKYGVTLFVEGNDLAFECTCPMGAEGAFCRHCVAAGLAWLADDMETSPPQKQTPLPPAATLDDARLWLANQDKNKLSPQNSVSEIVFPLRAIKAAAAHAAVFETGVLNYTGTDRSVRASRAAPCHRERLSHLS